METVTLEGGRRATYAVFGNGPPLLYFVGGPGLPAMGNVFDAELLQDRFAVYLIDPHGSGGSTPPGDPSEYDHFGHARFYDEVRRALGLDRVAVGGVSFGGTMSLTYASLHPDVVERCIAVSALALGEDVGGEDVEEEFERNLARHADASWYPGARDAMDNWTERVLAAEDSAVVDDMLRAVFPLYLAEPDQPDVRERIARLEEFLVGDLAATKAWEGGLYQTIDLRPLLPGVRCPTLVICGELDFICGPEQARVVANAVPDAVLAIIPACGHVPSIEQPEAFRRVALEWLDRTA
jgi:proline iminopeptidase